MKNSSFRDLKNLKRCLKNKVKITEMLLITFLITGRVACGFEILEDYHNEDNIVYNNNSGEEENVSLGSGVYLKNSGIISVAYKDGYSSTLLPLDLLQEKGNGISAFSGGNKIENEGIIKGSVEIKTGANEGLAGSVINLVGVPVVDSSGNGIFGDIETINNTGNISGKANLEVSTIDDFGILGSGINLSSAGIMGVASGNGVFGVVQNLLNKNTIKGGTNIIGGKLNLSAITPPILGLGINSSVRSLGSGNGLLGFQGDVENTRLISGKANLKGSEAELPTLLVVNISSFVTAEASGNGILRNFGNFKNSGIIKGDVNLEGGKITSVLPVVPGTLISWVKSEGSGNGIATGQSDIDNSGVVSGYFSIKSGEINLLKDCEEIVHSGNGISLYSDNLDKNILNTGVIKGNQSGIATTGVTLDSTINNYGIIAGRKIFGDGLELKTNGILTLGPEKMLGSILATNENNHGIYIKLKEDLEAFDRIKLDIDGDVVIEDITLGNLTGEVGVNNSGKTILNTDIIDVIEGSNVIGKDSHLTLNVNSIYENHIINGAGIKTGVLTLGNSAQLNMIDSVINAYKTALTIGESAVATITNTIINGGGLKGEDATIDLKGDNSKLNIKESSVVNGNIVASGNNTNINISNASIINGNISSLGMENNLNLGDNTEGDLNINYNINDFAHIVTEGKVTLSESTKINGTTDLNIKNGNLIVKIDSTEKNEDGFITGHGLYGTDGKLTVTVTPPSGEWIPGSEIDSQAMLNFKASGLGAGTIIELGETDLSAVNDWYIGTLSIAHTARKTTDNDNGGAGNVIVDIKNLDEIISGETKDEQGKIWDSIVNGGQVPELAPTLDSEDLNILGRQKALLSLLDQIYSNNPYTQSSKMSKENITLFRDEILNTKMPKLKEWIVEGHGIYGFSGYDKTESTAVGRTSVTNRYSNDLETWGLFGTGEYGVAKDSSLGFAFGGSKQNMDMSYDSKIKGDAIYFGIYGKRKIDRYTFTLGAAYQYGQYDVDRNISNEFQKIDNNGKVKTDSFDIYGEGKYTFEIENGIKIEPKIRLSQTFIKQKSVSEDNGALAMNLNKEDYSIPEVEVAVDLVKTLYLNTGKLDSIFSLGVARTFGDESTYTTAKMKNSTEFKVKGPDFRDTKLKISGKLDYELASGMFYNVGVGINTSEDLRREYTVKLGAGYRF